MVGVYELGIGNKICASIILMWLIKRAEGPGNANSHDQLCVNIERDIDIQKLFSARKYNIKYRLKG